MSPCETRLKVKLMTRYESEDVERIIEDIRENPSHYLSKNYAWLKSEIMDFAEECGAQV